MWNLTRLNTANKRAKQAAIRRALVIPLLVLFLFAVLVTYSHTYFRRSRSRRQIDHLIWIDSKVVELRPLRSSRLYLCINLGKYYKITRRHSLASEWRRMHFNQPDGFSLFVYWFLKRERALAPPPPPCHARARHICLK